MPSLYYRIEAPGVNVLKAVSDQVIYGLLYQLDLTQTFKDSVYPMASFMAPANYDTEGKPNLTGNTRCDVDISYVMDKSQVPWPVDSPYTTAAYGLRNSHRGNHTPVLYDAASGVMVEHATKACAVEMSFSMTFSTFDEACRAFDTIQSKYKGSIIKTPFDLAFSYPVSMNLYTLLFEVYKLKDDYQNKSFLDYLNDTKKTEISFDIRKSQLTDPNADKELMIRCQEINCVAQLTMDQKEPEVTRVNQLPDTFNVSFSFVVQFGRPDYLAVYLPVSIDNKVLPPVLFSSVMTNFYNNPAIGGVYQDLTCSEFMKRSYGDYNASGRIIRLPVYDDWFSADQQYSFYQYRPFLIAHFTLDGPVTTINLKQLDDVVLHPVAQAILTKMGNAVFDYGGIFTVGVYADNLRLGPELLSLDDDLNLTITSGRSDKVYHLMLSESTNLFKMNKDWDQLLIEYRYFFPLTIERNIQALVKKKYFYVAYDNIFLSIIDRIDGAGQLKALLKTMIDLGEDTNEIYGYTQNPSQLADYLALTPSQRHPYQLPTGTDPISVLVNQYYTTKASVNGRSLLVAFIEQCLIAGYMSLDQVPEQYLEPNRTIYPYYAGQGGYYGFNTPLRVFNITIEPERQQ
jgi:hypothetical protein